MHLSAIVNVCWQIKKISAPKKSQAKTLFLHLNVTMQSNQMAGVKAGRGVLKGEEGTDSSTTQA